METTILPLNSFLLFYHVEHTWQTSEAIFIFAETIEEHQFDCNPSCNQHVMTAFYHLLCLMTVNTY